MAMGPYAWPPWSRLNGLDDLRCPQKKRTAIFAIGPTRDYLTHEFVQVLFIRPYIEIIGNLQKMVLVVEGRIV